MKFRAVFVVFVFFVAANVPLWLASHSLSLLVGGLFSLEFLIIGVLSVFLRRTLTVCLLVAAIALDLLNSISKTYLFNYSDLFLGAPNLFEFAPSHLWNLVAVAICIGLVCLAAIIAINHCLDSKERKYVVGGLTIIAILCLAFDGCRGQIMALGSDRQVGQFRLVRNSLHALVMSGLQEWNFRRQAHSYAGTTMAGASTKMVELDTHELLRSNSTRPNVVFVLVESWGKALSNNTDDLLVQPYMATGLAKRYTVSRGTVPFQGPTIAGESRELCGNAMGFAVTTASASQLKNCLPAKFDLMGYHTIGVHGFSSKMYARATWYKQIKFDETWFRDQLQGQGLPVCPGPFPGICDAAVSNWIGDRLRTNSDSPQFIYWVTLNSHLPVPVPNLVKDPPACSSVANLAGSEALCSWYQLVFNVHRSVSEIAMTTTRPTVFVIVGDHAPPFCSPDLRAQFSDTVVPYVILWPKDGIMDDSQSTRSIATTAHPSDRTRTAPASKVKAPSHLSIGGY